MPRRWMAVLWPSFLMAAAGSGLFFSLIDPATVPVLGRPLVLPRVGAYTLGFLALWGFAAASSALTTFLLAPPAR